MPIGTSLRLALLAAGLVAGLGVSAARAECRLADGYLNEGVGEFEGVVGGERVRIFFTADRRYGRRDPDLTGLVRRVAHQDEEPQRLGGSVGGDCVITLTQAGDQKRPSATWTLHFVSAARLVGRRQVERGRRVRVRLDAATGPSCEGQEAWRTFRSPVWPVTFDYPASWLMLHIRDGERPRLALACPNLLHRAYEYSVDVIELTGGHGHGTIETRDGRTVRRVEDFFTEDGRRWRYGYCVGEDGRTDHCPEARLSTVNDVTVLQVRSDSARNGLYVYAFAFLTPTGWVSFDTLDVQDRIEGPGEIAFAGDARVLERFVRSVRPAP